MSTFADFSLVRAVQSYGGAEVLRARRLRRGAAGPPVHLALYGKAPVERRLTAAAEATAKANHARVAHIHEIGRNAGSLYAVADALEGLDLQGVLEHERRRRGALDAGLCLAVAYGLAQLATELQDKDVWAGARGAGISSLFAAGLRLDSVVLRSDGIAVRPLAGAADDPARPTPYRAPEIGARVSISSAATDVFCVSQVLRALLAGDPNAASAPRLTPATAGLAPVITGGLAPTVDERIGLHVLLDRLGRMLEEATGHKKPGAVIAAALAGPYKALVPPLLPDPPPPPEDARKAAAALPPQIAWPPIPEDEIRTLESVPTALVPRALIDDSEAVGRVFTEEGDATPTFAILDPDSRAFASDETTQKLERGSPPAPASPRAAPAPVPSEPPWASLSDVVPVDESGKRPPSAPVVSVSQIESGPTVEMKSPFDDDEETE